MSTLAEVLNNFEAELELERELGVRVIDIDRTLLKPLEKGMSGRADETTTTDSQHPTPDDRSMRQPTADSQRSALGSKRGSAIADGSQPPTANFDFVFLHHKMLSSGGVAMMAKIITAMKKTPETAPIMFTGERPKAKVYVVLGGKAMNMWFPEIRCSPGQWARGSKGEDVLVTYSPEYILRFGAETESVKKIKTEMWTSLKGVLKKI